MNLKYWLNLVLSSSTRSSTVSSFNDPKPPVVPKTFADVLRSELVVQRKELSGIPQPLFPGLRVASGGDAVSPLTPFGELDRVSFGLLASRGGEDDLQQSPHIRQRQAVLVFFPRDAAPAGPGTTSPA
jgi:hypothetical protein